MPYHGQVEKTVKAEGRDHVIPPNSAAECGFGPPIGGRTAFVPAGSRRWIRGAGPASRSQFGPEEFDRSGPGQSGGFLVVLRPVGFEDPVLGPWVRMERRASLPGCQPVPERFDVIRGLEPIVFGEVSEDRCCDVRVVSAARTVEEDGDVDVDRSGSNDLQPVEGAHGEAHQAEPAAAVGMLGEIRQRGGDVLDRSGSIEIRSDGLYLLDRGRDGTAIEVGGHVEVSHSRPNGGVSPVVVDRYGYPA